MKKILLATDLTAKSDRALGRAIKLSLQHSAKLFIVHVLPDYKSKKLRANLKKEARDLLEGHLCEYKDAENIDIQIDILEGGAPYEEILAYEQVLKADIIVMGLHGKSKFKDFFRGTTIERIARLSTKPILMVKKKATGSYQSIVSGIDFAPASRNALRVAMEIAPKGVFEIIHTYDIPVGYPTTADFSAELITQTEKAQMQTLLSFMKTEDTYFKKMHNGESKKLSQKLIEGFTYDILKKEVKIAKADLLTIGAHGASFLAPTKLGGVAYDILANPPCDVLLVRE